MNQFQPDYASKPGDTIIELLFDRDMTISELARQTGTEYQTMKRIILDGAELMPEIADKLATVFGDYPTSFWLNREQQYREALARLK